LGLSGVRPAGAGQKVVVMSESPVKVVVSLCLLGIDCTYSGGNNRFQPAVDLFEVGNAVAVCPEQLGGLPTPREPVEIRDGIVVDRSGRDLTAVLTKGAVAALTLARLTGCRRGLLKARSPSCGCGAIYDGTFRHRLIAGDGVFAALLKSEGIVVDTELTWPGKSMSGISMPFD
jgi:uncharacterized protein YbbK (DUF523 family)